MSCCRFSSLLLSPSLAAAAAEVVVTSGKTLSPKGSGDGNTGTRSRNGFKLKHG